MSASTDQRNALPRRGASSRSKVLAAVAAIAIVLALFLCSYFSIFNPNNTDPKGTRVALQVVTFDPVIMTNSTINHGGWTVTIQDVMGDAIPLSELSIELYNTIPEPILEYYMEGVSKDNSSVYNESPSTHWYLKACKEGPRYMEEGVPTDLTNQSSKDVDKVTKGQVYKDEFKTIEGACLVYLDNDNDAKMSRYDEIVLFADVDSDDRVELYSSSAIRLMQGRAVIGESYLGS